MGAAVWAFPNSLQQQQQQQQQRQLLGAGEWAWLCAPLKVTQLTGRGFLDRDIRRLRWLPALLTLPDVAADAV